MDEPVQERVKMVRITSKGGKATTQPTLLSKDKDIEPTTEDKGIVEVSTQSKTTTKVENKEPTKGVDTTKVEAKVVERETATKRLRVKVIVKAQKSITIW